MKRGEALTALLFRIVCLGFSAALLILALFSQIRLVRTETRAAELRKSIDTAENERIILKVQIDRALNLEELERRAVQELGMRRPEPGQICVTEYMG